MVVDAPRAAERTKPTGYREFELDPATLQSILGAVHAKHPSEIGFLPFEVPLDVEPAEIHAQITIPAPDGGILKFTIEDSTTLSPALAEHPEIRTFRGVSADDPRSDLHLQIRLAKNLTLLRDQ